jgi:Domain of unknown function (DUF4331)
MGDPSVDITDFYTFPSPECRGNLVLIMDVFPMASPHALFSDAVAYRFRLRPLTRAGGNFVHGAEEQTIDVSFSDLTDGISAQRGTFVTSDGRTNIVGVARLHRTIRRSSSYGPMLPEGVLEDDGADRGILFFSLQANLARGFEFVKTQWINEGTFFGSPDEMDPMVGPNDGTRTFTIPQQPIRRRLAELPQFVVNRGGEYCFMPGLRALRWLADLDT